MDTINERIAKVLADSGLSQADFAEKLNVSQQYISKLTKSGVPSDRTISDICKKFNVFEPWLRNGEGEMRVKTSKKGEIISIVTDIMNDDSDCRKRLISALTQMTPEETELLAKVAVKLLDEFKNAGP